LETGRFLLRSTNTGLTAIVAPTGKITHQLPLFEVGVLSDTITPMGGLTPYSLLGDVPIICFVGLLLLVMWVHHYFKLSGVR
jgi:apolipoprotein N-acyltransferase